MEWTDLFEEHMLSRGFSYFCDGAVGELTVDRGVLTADVTGMEVYHVKIPLDIRKRDGFSCTCPYAKDGRRCKHMAAALFKWDSQGRPKKDTAHTLPPWEVRQMTAQADEALVRSYLTAVLLENHKLAVQFKDLWLLWQDGMPGANGTMQ